MSNIPRFLNGTIWEARGHNIGKTIRERRLRLGLTITKLASETGFSPGYICSIEKSRVNSSVGALYKIAKVLGVSPGVLLDGSTPSEQKEIQTQILKRDQRVRLFYPGTDFACELLTRNISTRQVEFMELRMPGNSGSGDKRWIHDGQEYGVVIKGKLTVILGDQNHILEEGDSVFFQCTTPHGLQNNGSVEVQAVWVLVPPQI